MLELRVVADVAEPLIGPIGLVERVQGFFGNECFRLSAENGETFYLKSGAKEAVRAEAWACEQARQVGVLAPSVITVELEPTTVPTAYLIERAIPGQPISPADEQILTSVGEQLRQLHGITGTRYGFLHKGLKDTWAEVIRQPFDQLNDLVTANIITTDLAYRLAALDPLTALAQLTALAPTDKTQLTPVLLHADLHPRHIYAAEGKLSGIIDWGDAAFGDPLFDLGRFSRAGSAPTTALLTGYGLERTPELDRTLAVYRLTWSLLVLHWELEAGGDWFAAHVDAIAADLPLLEA
jgi:aminoglycoside phosphotransferase (APT) family kinase protein